MLSGCSSRRIRPRSRLVEWNLQRDVGMTCGGVVKLFFETYNHRAWRIVVFGAGHVARRSFAVWWRWSARSCASIRGPSGSRSCPHSGKLTKIQTDDMPSQVAQLVDDDFVICMTMGHRTDRPILEEIFRQQRRPAYLGVIGSEAKRKIMIRELVEGGLDPATAEQFRCPIGLRIGQNQPGEIAVSVAAELIQVRDSLLTPEFLKRQFFSRDGWAQRPADGVGMK